MAADIFISYARDSSKAEAAALRRTIGDRYSVFMDTDAIKPGQSFPPALLDALFGARVVVIFAHADYYTRTWCWWEARAALGAFDWPATEPGRTADDGGRGAGIVIAIPTDKTDAINALAPLPSSLQDRNWPLATDTEAIVEVVASELERPSLGTLAERIDHYRGRGAAVRLREELVAEGRLPPPQRLAGIPCVPKPLPASLVHRFRGRFDELEALGRALRARPGEAYPVIAISSMGGMGKTTLAREFMHRYGGSLFRGGLFWIDADAHVREQQFRVLEEVDAMTGGRVAARFGGQFPDHAQYRDAGGDEYASRLESDLFTAFGLLPPDTPALVVVDNVPERMEDGAELSLDTLAPMRGQASVMLTSRLRFGDDSDGVGGFELGRLDRGSAARVLMHGLTDVDRFPPEKWQRIVEWVDDLPLALRLLNGAMAKHAYTPEELAARAEQSAGQADTLEDLQSVYKRHQDVRMRAGVKEALKLSYDALPPLAQRLARAIALLAPAAIPIAVMEALEREVAPNARAAEVRAARAELVARSFVEASDAAHAPQQTGVPMLGDMHRVLADVVRGLTSEEEREELTRAVVKTLAHLAPVDRLRDPKHWPLLHATLPHNAQILSAIVHRPSAPDEIQSVAELHSATVMLLLNLSYHQDARAVAEGFAKASIAWFGETHLRTLAFAQILELVVTQDGKASQVFDARRQTLDQYARDFGPQHFLTAVAQFQLAQSYEGLGDYAAARDLVADAIAVAEVQVEPNTEFILRLRSHMCWLLTQVGEHAEAIRLQREILATCERDLGADSDTTLDAKTNLAQALAAAGQKQEAVDLLSDVLNQSRAAFGETHKMTMLTRHNLAGLSAGTSWFAQALASEKEVAEWLAGQYGPEHPSTLTAQHMLAQMHEMAGDLRSAYSLHATVLSARTRSLGSTNPATEATRQALAKGIAAMLERSRALRASGDSGGAEALLRDAAALGSAHLPDLPATREAIAELMSASASSSRAPS